MIAGVSREMKIDQKTAWNLNRNQLGVGSAATEAYSGATEGIYSP